MRSKVDEDWEKEWKRRNKKVSRLKKHCLVGLLKITKTLRWKKILVLDFLIIQKGNETCAKVVCFVLSWLVSFSVRFLLIFEMKIIISSCFVFRKKNDLIFKCKLFVSLFHSLLHFIQVLCWWWQQQKKCNKNRYNFYHRCNFSLTDIKFLSSFRSKWGENPV